MTMSSVSRLYTPELLNLAVRLADFPPDAALPFKGSARSRTCGSTIAAGFALDGCQRISAIGMAVSACAVGQAAAAIFAEGATGRNLADIEATLTGMENWLGGEAERPDWPGLGVLDAARSHAGRHGAILLPWRAGLDALCKQPLAG